MSHTIWTLSNINHLIVQYIFKPNETNEANHLFGTGNFQLGNFASEIEHVKRTWQHPQDPCCLAGSNRSHP